MESNNEESQEYQSGEEDFNDSDVISDDDLKGDDSGITQDASSALRSQRSGL